MIEEFLLHYRREVDHYEQAARIAAKICDLALRREGIKGLVTYRAKDPESLKEKLITRDVSEKFESAADVYESIVDLAGVRIALYFPSDRDRVSKIIEDSFYLRRNPIVFPKKDIYTCVSRYPREWSGTSIRTVWAPSRFS